MKVLVTGAGGFLGSHVVSALLDRGHAVRAVLRPAAGEPPSSWKGRAEILRADLRSPKDAEQWFEGIDSVIHLAAAVRGTPEAQFAGSVVATEKFLDAMRRAGTARHLVLAGSFSVYDWTASKKKMTEETPLESKPYERDGYTVAKLWQERVARRLSEKNGWTLTVLRPGFIYGPGAPEVTGAGFGVGKAYLVVGPLARLPLTHVENCAEAFADAAEKKISGTFNIIDDEKVTAWGYSSRLFKNKPARLRLPFSYLAGLCLATLAVGVSRLLFPPSGGKLPGLLVPRRYRARFRPLRFDNHPAKTTLGWKPRPLFAAGGPVI